MSLPEPAVLPTLSLAAAWTRYESIRGRLPSVARQGACRPAADLSAVAGDYDGFIFDSFGVLNVGDTAIPGAAACLDALRAADKPFCVLTNAASHDVDGALAKYRRMKLDIRREQVISSRDIALAHLDRMAPGVTWGVIAAAGDRFGDCPAPAHDLLDPGADWDAAGGVLFLSSARWTPRLQDRLVAALIRRPRPVVIGNPDLVAPREGGLSLEPGYWAHDLQDRTGIAPRLFGKPYPEAFRAATDRLGPGRLAMIGDTLHTDILGGMAAGLDAILVTDHGIFAGRDTAPFITASGIRPDVILPGI